VSDQKVRIVSRNEPAKLPGGVAIEAFPESGLAGTIAFSCLVASLKLTLVGEISSDSFPPLATVLDGKLQAPARVYADTERKIAVFLGDFSPGQRASHILARSIIDWAAQRSAYLLMMLASFRNSGCASRTLRPAAGSPLE
jgi:predicted ATP-grasp superfamily ATP-dependent carboligase